MLIFLSKNLRGNVKYFLCLLFYSLFSQTVHADDIKMPASMYQLLYADSGKIDARNDMYNNIDDNGDNSKHNQNNSDNKYKDIFTFAGVSFGTSGFGINAGGNYKMFGIRFSAQTLQINSPIKASKYVSLKLFNGGDYGIDFMFRPTSYFHIDIGFHYFKNIVTVYYKNTKLASSIELDGYVGGEVDVKIGYKIVSYFGFGFNIRLFAQLYLDIDLGVMFTGEYKINKFKIYLEDTGGNRVSADMDPSHENIKYVTNYDSKQNNYKVWPIAKIGFSYRYNL